MSSTESVSFRSSQILYPQDGNLELTPFSWTCFLQILDCCKYIWLVYESHCSTDHIYQQTHYRYGISAEKCGVADKHCLFRDCTSPEGKESLDTNVQPENDDVDDMLSGGDTTWFRMKGHDQSHAPCLNLQKSLNCWPF